MSETTRRLGAERYGSVRESATGQDPEDASRLGPAEHGSGPSAIRPGDLAARLIEHLQHRWDEPAIREGDRIWTGRMLHEAAHGIAMDLRRSGIEPGSRLALDLPRSIDLWATVLGCILAGIAYAPVARGLSPESRLDMARKTRCSAILSRDRLGSDGGTPLAEIGVLSPLLPEQAPDPGKPESGPEIYCVRTSGTTGEPKVVPIRERQLDAFLGAATARLAIAPGQTWLWMHDLSFDLSVWELYGCLVADGCVVVLTEAAKREPRAAGALLASARVNVLMATPSEFRFLFGSDLDADAALEPLRVLMFCGEKLSGSTLRDVYPILERNGTRVFNTYGPSEGTVFYTAHDVRAEDVDLPSIPFGTFLVGTAGRLTDGEAEGAGELTLSGVQVFDGYEGRALLTEGYPTGDICRRDPQGSLVFVNRRGGFTKVNGHRVETSEIEEHLLGIDSVDEAVVFVEESELAGEHILACVMVRDEAAISTRSLRLSCNSLAPYLRPARYLLVPPASWPINAHGKTDRTALRRLAHERS